MSADGTSAFRSPVTAGIQQDELAGFLQQCPDYSTPVEFWNAVRENIKERLGLKRYSFWFQQTELMSVADGRVVVGVPNVIIQQFLTVRYADAVAAAVAELSGRRMSVTFDVAPRLFRQMRALREKELREAEPAAAKVIDFQPSRQVLTPVRRSFGDLVVTRANALPFAAAREFAGQERPRFRFLYVSGDYGMGKTALLWAIHGLASGPERGFQPVYVTAEEWCNEYYYAIPRKTTRAFRSRYRSAAMLLVDDIQFIEGKPGAQTELLHTIKHVLERGGRMALSSKPHPEELRDIDPALAAVLQRSFPARIEPPDSSEVDTVVKQIAEKRGLKATREVLQAVARSHGSSFASIESAIAALELHAGVAGGGRVGLTAALRTLEARRPAAGRPVDLGDVQEAVVGLFPVTAEQLTGRSRSRTVCRARQTAIFLARNLTGASLSEIGRFFGGLAHSTVKYAVSKIESESRADPQLGALVRRLEETLGKP